MNNEIWVTAKYTNYTKLMGMPFRPFKDDTIVDKGIKMDVIDVLINKDIQDGIIMYVRIHNANYHDQEDLYVDMVNKGWKKENK